MFSELSIIIKSFNRPFYLDRCLQSIFENVSGNYEIIVVDDGTPEKYLNKIRAKYPEIEIKLSEQYLKKNKAIEENIATANEINGFEIPTDLWRKTVENAREFVLVTEDDVWFTQKINLEEMAGHMNSKQIHLLKLGWLGNFKDDEFVKIENLEKNISRVIPKKLFTSNQVVMDVFMYNKFKLFSILCRLGITDNSTKGKYWSLNSILMGLYRKEYWLHIWKDAKGKVDEKQQLRNAAVWYHQNKKNKNLIARTESEHMKTTFQSSATNSYHQYGFDFDVNYFNFKMNEAWYNDKLDPMQNFPDDFSLNYLEEFFDEKIDKNEFHDWVKKFKDQYRNLGAQVD